MKKEEYLFMVIDEIKKAKKIKEENINKKDFYQKINGDKNIIRSLDNNIELYNKTIESLENIIYLPVYEIIKKMSNNDLINYKRDLISKIDNDIFKEFNNIERLKEECKELNKNIDDIMAYYLIYKKENVLNEQELYSYVTECKELQNTLDELNNEIKQHEKDISDLKTKKNIVENKTIEDIREYLINTYNLNKIEYELDRYKVTRSDEIIVNICKDLNILDNIESLIKEYIILRDKSVQKIIEVPNIFKEYKTNIINSILTKCKNINYHERTNELVIFDEKEIDFIKDGIDKAIKEINYQKHKLIEFKLKVNQLSNLTFDTINYDLVNFVSELCNTLYLTELEKNNINILFNEYNKLVNKKHKTVNNIDKSINIEKRLRYEIKNILDIYWGILCDSLESLFTGIKSDVEFINDIHLYDVNNCKDKVLFDIEEFSEIGLLNMRIVIKNILSKYTIYTDKLKSFNNDLTYIKEKMIDNKNNKEKELINIKKRIDELYYKISPNDFPILIEDYDNLNKIFKEKTLIDSIVKINRKDLISKVRSESVNYREKDNILSQDIEVIKKKVLNKD